MNKELAQIIKFHRKKSGLSQAKLAVLSGVGKTVIFDIKTVETTLTVKAGETRTYPGSVKYHNGVNTTQSRVKLVGG